MKKTKIYKNESLYKNLERTASSNNMKLIDIANAIDVHRATLYSYKFRRPKEQYYEKLAKFLKVDINKLKALPIEKNEKHKYIKKADRN